MVGNELQQKLGEIRRSSLVVRGACALGWGTAAGMVFLGLGMWVDLLVELPAGLRMAWVVMAAVIAGLIMARAAATALRAGRAEVLARRIDRVAGTGGQVLAGVELEEQARGTGLTAQLAELAVRRAGELAGRVSNGAVVPVGAAVRAWCPVAALAAVAVVVAWGAPRLWQTQWLRFDDIGGDHPPYSRVIINVEPGDTKVVYGQGVDIRASTGGATVDRMDLVIEGAGREAEVLPMFLEPGGRWRTTIADVTSASRYFVRSGGARSRRFDLDVITVPSMEQVMFRITPPAYTQLPAYEGPAPQGGIVGLAGTEVRVTVRSNRPLSGGQIGFAPAGKAPGKLAPLWPAPAQEEGMEVSGSFVIREAGKMSLSIMDVAGQASMQTFTAPVSLLVDERPFVRVLEPRNNSFATPDAVIPVALSAEDDYGISRLALMRTLNNSAAAPQELAVPPLVKPLGPATKLAPTAPLELAPYGLNVGDVIQLYAHVEDNDPAGAKGSDSSVVSVQIISQEEFEKMLVATEGIDALLSKYQQAVRELEDLQEETAKLEAELGKGGDKLTADEKKALEELARKMRADAAGLDKAADEVLPVDIDKALTEQLRQLARSLEREAGEVAVAEGQGPGPAADDLKGVGQALEAKKKEFEKQVTEPLEYLAKIYPLIADQQKFVGLAQRQRSLAQRLEPLAGHEGEDDPDLKARMRDMESEQRQVRESLVDLMGDIETQAAELPEDGRLDKLRETATDFVASVRQSGGSEAMTAAESALAEFAATEAQKNADNAADILEGFILKGGEGGAAGQMGQMAANDLIFQPMLGGILGDTVRQLMAAAPSGQGQPGGAGGFGGEAESEPSGGLYGRAPSSGGSGGHAGKRHAGAAGRAESGVLAARGPGENVAGAGGNGEAGTGGADAAVPGQYRQRVGEYFRRAADETDENH